LTAEDLKKMVADFKAVCKEFTGKDFPDDPWEQLWGAELLQFLIAG
jgi:pyruvate,orthophosphate dikinase